jgi:hypothetical protein
MAENSIGEDMRVFTVYIVGMECIYLYKKILNQYLSNYWNLQFKHLGSYWNIYFT